jgi:predicted ATP-binding protein involved in virulence
MAVRSKRGVFLTQLALKNVKSFAGEQTLDLTDEKGNPARWTLLLGDNGVGKTTLLECLAHLAPVFNSDESGAPDPRFYVEPRVAREENPVIYALGRIGDHACEARASFAVHAMLNRAGSDEVIETSVSFTLIVLIDEIDLHLHPNWQRQIRELLTNHFPNVQFISTAHSP